MYLHIYGYEAFLLDSKFYFHDIKFLQLAYESATN